MLTGTGPAFSAGTDLEEFLSAIVAGSPPVGAERAFPDLVDALSEVDVPLLAAVNGPGVGLGATMLAYFDLVFMAETARLRAPFAAMGVPPEAASSLLFPLRMDGSVPPRHCSSSKWLSATEALAVVSSPP